MSWRAHQSSHLNGSSYDADAQTLDVQFVNGAVYRYFGVPQTAYDTLCQSGSSRDFFNDKIKGVYKFTMLIAGQTASGRRSRKRF